MKMKTKISNLDRLIALNNKKTSLLMELKNSLIYEVCSHTIECNTGRNNNFFLINIASKKIIFDGTVYEIEKYCSRRNIEFSKIFNLEKYK